MPNNLGIDTKIKSLACSEWKLQIWPKWPQKAIWALRSIWGIWKWSQWISNAQKPGDTKSILVCSEPKLQVWPCNHILTCRIGHKWPFWQLRPIWGVWTRPQWISHTQKPRDRHQNQLSSMFRTKVTDLAILPYFDWPKWPQMAILATRVNLRSLKIVPMNFPYQKTWG